MSGARRRPWLGAVVVALAWVVGCKVDALFQAGRAPDPPPSQLVFAPPPDGTAGQPLSPAVQVSAVDDAGNVDTTFTLAVTVTLGANPGGATLAGTRTVDAVKGVATFADLSLNEPGTNYTLVATAPGARGATSPPFDITAAPPTTGSITVTTSTTGQGQPTTYTVTLDGGQSRSIAANGGSTPHARRSAPPPTRALPDAPANRTASGGG